MASSGAGKAGFNLSGIESSIAAINEAVKAAGDKAKEALRDDSFDLLANSVKRAPKDTGDLRGSGFVREDDKEESAWEIGFTEPYATVQHEHLEYHHTNGEAKYLERPLNENVQKYVQHISDAAREGIEGK